MIPDPDVTHVKLSKGDAFVIIASDGLWDYVSPDAAGVSNVFSYCRMCSLTVECVLLL